MSYLKIAQAAAELNVSQATIRRLIDRGELRAVYVGRVLRVPSVELSRYVRERLTGASHDAA